jgi:hypothetical protein
MKNRCNNKNSTDYPRYGLRGIKVCDRWENYQNFFDDMFPTYQKGLSIDRIDNEKGYYKENCRWSTKKQQNNNTRKNLKITYRGITKNMIQWAEYFKIRPGTLYQRYFTYRWSIEKCFTFQRGGEYIVKD